MSKTASGMFISNGEIDRAKLRGALKKFGEWADEQDDFLDGVGLSGHMPTVISKEFGYWINGKVDDDWFEFKRNWDYDNSVKDVIKRFYRDHKAFRQSMQDSFKVVDSTGDVKGTYSVYKGYRSDEDFDGGDDEDNEMESESGNIDISEAKEVFCDVNDNQEWEVNKGKVMGAMKKWANSVDEIKGPDTNEEFFNKFHSFDNYMRSKVDGWSKFLNGRLGKQECKRLFRKFIKDNPEVAEEIDSKYYEYDKEEKIGNSKNKSGINKYVEQEGTSNGQEHDKIRKNARSDIDEDEWGGESVPGYVKTDGQGGDGEGDDDDDGSSDSVNVEEEGGDLTSFAEKEGTTDSLRSDESSNNTGPRFDKSTGGGLSRNQRYDEEDIRNNVMQGNTWEEVHYYPDNCVDCIVTSPPYWDLRDYGEDADRAVLGGRVTCDHTFNVNHVCTKCGAFNGQLGGEEDPFRFVKHIVETFNELKRVLKPTGSIFLNIGDTYAKQDHTGTIKVNDKSKMHIPWRIVIGLTECGYLCRNDIIWMKQHLDKGGEVHGSCNPVSVTDRINDNAWEPIYWLTNTGDYWHNVWDVRVEPKTDQEFSEATESKYVEDDDAEMYNSPTARAAREGYTPSLYHPAGSNIPEVWEIPTGSTQDSHFAVFSEELPKRPIQMACPEMVCDNCGVPYARDVETDRENDEFHDYGYKKACNCPTDETKPGLVMDPFLGRGTTAKVAVQMGRDWTGIEIEEDNVENIIEQYVPKSEETLAGWSN